MRNILIIILILNDINLIITTIALNEFKTALDGSGWKWGVYSSESQWSQIVGASDWELDSSVPVWYAHWNDAKSFDGFTPFGGWTTPTVKVYYYYYYYYYFIYDTIIIQSSMFGYQRY